MAKKLFQYAVIYNPKETKDAQGNDTTPDSKLLVEPKWILANSDKQVAVVAARSIPDEYLDKLEQVEISVRPF